MWSEADEECGRRAAAKVQADEERRAAENQSRLSDVALFGRIFLTISSTEDERAGA